MTRRNANSPKKNSRTATPFLRGIVIVSVIAIAVLLLLLRLWNFTHGHLRRY